MNKVVKLSTTITVEGKQVSQVEMRVPVLAGDWRAASRACGGDADERTFHLASRMSGLAPADLEKMTMHDFQAVIEGLDMGDPDPKAPSSQST